MGFSMASASAPQRKAGHRRIRAAERYIDDYIKYTLGSEPRRNFSTDGSAPGECADAGPPAADHGTHLEWMVFTLPTTS